MTEQVAAGAGQHRRRDGEPAVWAVVTSTVVVVSPSEVVVVFAIVVARVVLVVDTDEVVEVEVDVEKDVESDALELDEVELEGVEPRALKLDDVGSQVQCESSRLPPGTLSVAPRRVSPEGVSTR